MPQNNIVFIDSTRQNALSLTGQVNTLNALLYQLLCTGFNSGSTTITRSGSVATATRNGHGFRTYDWVTIAGADQTEYNGMKLVTGYDANTFTFAVTGTPASPATGTITSALAPLGWTRDYNSGNKSVFHGDDQSSLLPIYIDDSGAIGSNSYRGAWFCGYESWNVNIGVNAWPTVALAATGLYWNKSSTLDGTARGWWIRGDGKRFLMGIFWNANYSDRCDVFGFGDYLPRIPGFAYPGFIIGATSDSYSGYPGQTNPFGTLTSLGTTQAGHYLCRKYDASGSAIAFGKMGNNAISTTLGSGGLPSSNPATSGYELTPIDIHAGASLSVASFYSPLPGAYHLLHDQLFTTFDLVPAPSELAGRRLMVFKVSTAGNQVGRLVLDLTGPDE